MLPRLENLQHGRPRGRAAGENQTLLVLLADPFMEDPPAAALLLLVALDVAADWLCDSSFNAGRLGDTDVVGSNKRSLLGVLVDSNKSDRLAGGWVGLGDWAATSESL